MLKRCIFMGLMLLLVSLLLAGCGIPQEDYDVVIAERDGAQADVVSLRSDLATAESDLAAAQTQISTLQTNLEKANEDIEKIQSDLTTQEDNVSLMTETLIEIGYPRFFSTLSELTDWLQEDDTDIEHADKDWPELCYILQIKALRDGYLLPADVDVEGDTNLWSNMAIIGDSIYMVFPDTDEVSWYAYLPSALPSRPLPLD